MNQILFLLLILGIIYYFIIIENFALFKNNIDLSSNESINKFNIPNINMQFNPSNSLITSEVSNINKTNINDNINNESINDLKVFPAFNLKTNEEDRLEDNKIYGTVNVISNTTDHNKCLTGLKFSMYNKGYNFANDIIVPFENTNSAQKFYESNYNYKYLSIN